VFGDHPEVRCREVRAVGLCGLPQLRIAACPCAQAPRQQLAPTVAVYWLADLNKPGDIIEPKTDFCVLKPAGDGRNIVMAMHLGNPGYRRHGADFCAFMGALHHKLTTIATPIKRSSAKQGANDKVFMTGYRTPQGNSYLGRYHGGGEPEQLADYIVNYEYPLIQLHFPQAYRVCVDHIMQSRLHQEMPPCVGASVFTSKSCTDGSYGPASHDDPRDFDHGWVLHWDHLTCGNAIKDGGFELGRRLRYQPDNGSMLYLRTKSVMHRNIPCATLMPERQGE
jgi:hypothetical protein